MNKALQALEKLAAENNMIINTQKTNYQLKSIIFWDMTLCSP
jgi:hypothetical protein